MQRDPNTQFDMNSTVEELRNEIDRIRSQWMALELSNTSPENMEAVLAEHQKLWVRVAKNRVHRNANVPMEENKAHSLVMLRNIKTKLERTKLRYGRTR